MLRLMLTMVMKRQLSSLYSFSSDNIESTASNSSSVIRLFHICIGPIAARQQLGTHTPMAMNAQAMEELFEALVPIHSISYQRKVCDFLSTTCISSN
jgi:hypothetical protein